MIEDPECICTGNWRNLVKEYEPLFGKKFVDCVTGKIWILFGLLHTDDDYYFAMVNETEKTQFLSCVGGLTKESWGFEQVKEDND